MPRLTSVLLAAVLVPLPLSTPDPHPDSFLAAGVIIGHVRDDAGVPIANAQVSVVSTTRSALTNGHGEYRLVGVPAGTYRLRAAFIGYRAVVREGVMVRSGDSTVVDFTLTASTVVIEDLVVTSAAPMAPRDEVTSRQRISGQYTNALPVEAAGAGVSPAHRERYRRQQEPWNTEEYAYLKENRWLGARNNPLSTFSIDVDRASYANVRRFLMSGQRPPVDAVRIEELVNYFDYNYAEPMGRHPFSVTTDIAPAPWRPEHRLVRIGLQGRRGDRREMPPSNLVFLIDVSGSMHSPDKLPLVQQSLGVLVDKLRPEDQVAIVVYAGSAGLVLPSTSGAHRERIRHAIDRLRAGGSTAGGAGIRLAYRVAREQFLPEGNNRVILATDGDFNVGMSSESELVRLVEAEGKGGIHLTVLGFGTGNYKDSRMESLADKGDGNFAYVDNILEAQKVFGSELTGTLFTIAKDVKIQVEFNPAKVRAYRLIGYENRMLATEDFDDDTKDAGELGAGHRVTALYEVVPVGADTDLDLPDVTPLKYQQPSGARIGPSDEWLTVKLRYQPSKGGRSTLLSQTLGTRDAVGQVDGDFAFAAAVAEFGMLLRESEHRGESSWEEVLRLAARGRGEDAYGIRGEFIRLVHAARGMVDQVAQRE
jgi:Ca-activated chloride channel family protein